MEKSSKGPKPVKLPEVLFGSWTAIASSDLTPIELEQVQVLVEPIASLGHFAAQENLRDEHSFHLSKPVSAA
ncbi:unnamed protein product [Rhizopus stolonifer]